MTEKLSERVSDGEFHDCCTGITEDLAAQIAALEQRLEAVEQEKQQAIDAAFEHVAGLFDRVGKHDEAGFLRSWRGTNPLAERDARIAELERELAEARKENTNA